MGRIRRQRLGRGVYHVFNRGLDRKWVFADDTDRDSFLKMLARFEPKRGLLVYHWVIMSNHFHLAVESVAPDLLSSYIGKVCRRFSCWHHARHGGCGPLWQGRFRSILVQKKGYLERLARYIERNPLRAAVPEAMDVRDWRWSSARAYLLDTRDGLTADIDQHPCFGEASGDNDDQKKAFRRWYEHLVTDAEAAAEDLALFRNETRVIGDERFCRAARWRQGRATDRGRGRRRQ